MALPAVVAWIIARLDSHRPMHSDEDAFLRAIRDKPEDDAPRLIFADWLDDHEQPERAEYLRIEVEAYRRQERVEDDLTAEEKHLRFMTRAAGLTFKDRPPWNEVKLREVPIKELHERARQLLRLHGKDWPALPARRIREPATRFWLGRRIHAERNDFRPYTIDFSQMLRDGDRITNATVEINAGRIQHFLDSTITLNGREVEFGIGYLESGRYTIIARATTQRGETLSTDVYLTIGL